jgi:hypothetical protein
MGMVIGPEFFRVPFHLFLFFFNFFYFLFYSKSGQISDYNPGNFKTTYIRTCYYRLISEILLIDFSKSTTCKLVVLGSPGIGKSCLLFMLIRVLLELGVEVRSFLLLFLSAVL